jgi:endonuclease/exonuclease/phosphatase family metal-dependent hydrolase
MPIPLLNRLFHTEAAAPSRSSASNTRRGISSGLVALIVAAVVAAGAVLASRFVTPARPTDRGSPTPSQAPQSPSPTPAQSPAGSVAPPESGVGQTPAVIRFGVERPVPRPAGTIRIASYNVENLFDPPATGRPDPAQPVKPDEHRDGLARAIRAIDADVLALQEVGSLEVLKKFRDEYLADMGYEHVVSIDAGDSRGIENSVLSRFPLRDPTLWIGLELGGSQPDRMGRDRNPEAGRPFAFRRSPLRVTVEVPASRVADILTGKAGAEDARPYILTLFVVHHKAGRSAGEQEWRLWEARKIVELAKEVEQTIDGANIIVLGDFNAGLDEPPMRTYLDAGFVDAFKERSTGDPRFLTHASQRAIDFILLNQNARHELVPETAFILGTPQRPLNMDWRTTPPPPGYASDHSPVVIDLRPAD